MTIRLDTIRECFEGVIPAVLATADLDGIPNVSYLSQVQYVDHTHLALSYQFFNRTRRNILANPQARLMVINPLTAEQYQLTLAFQRTETGGPLFESMKAKLAGIASHVGMSGVFHLLGSDIFQVTAIERLGGEALAPPAPPRNLLSALRLSTARLLECRDLEQLFDETLICLRQHLDIDHAMLLLHDEPSASLYTVASLGYEVSGVGSEIPLGQGVIGVAARERTPIRISHMTAEYNYSRAIRRNLRGSTLESALDTEIPLPGLAQSGSQLAVPIIGCARLIGVLYVESPQDLRFSYDDEDALVTLSAQLAMAMHIMQNALQGAAPSGEPAEHTAQPTAPPAPAVMPPGPPLTIRYYPENGSVFFGCDYLIKGVAGHILWSLVQDYSTQGKDSFSNRELRLDPRLRLPDVSDNLEARLLLLARRLAERDCGVQIAKTGRGHFRLCVARPLQVQTISAE